MKHKSTQSLVFVVFNNMKPKGEKKITVLLRDSEFASEGTGVNQGKNGREVRNIHVCVCMCVCVCSFNDNYDYCMLSICQRL